MNAALDQFRAAMQRRSIVPPDQLVTGQMARANAEGKRGKADASYIFFGDGVPAGGFENHRDGLGWETWKADIGRNLSVAEVEAQRERMATTQRLREEADEARRAEARLTARAIWETTQPASRRWARSSGDHTCATVSLRPGAARSTTWPASSAAR